MRVRMSGSERGAVEQSAAPTRRNIFIMPSALTKTDPLLLIEADPLAAHVLVVS
jgi:hypothetical protein